MKCLVPESRFSPSERSRFSPSERSDTTLFSLDSLPVSDLTELPYPLLEEASGHFDQRPYKEGGHKLGCGGFGEVFHCRLHLLGSLKEVAVKALLSKVGVVILLGR